MCFAALALLGMLCVPARAQKTASLTGLVTDEWDRPLFGAHITLPSNERIIQTTSDSTGHFDVMGLTDYSSEVNITADGFANIRRFLFQSALSQSRRNGKPIELKIVMHPDNPCGARDTLSYSEASSRDGGTLNGVVISDHYSKAPVAGAHLVIYEYQKKVSEQDTNDLGEFSFKPARPGRYIIFVRDPAYRELKSLVWVTRQNATHVILEPIPANKIVVCQ